MNGSILRASLAGMCSEMSKFLMIPAIRVVSPDVSKLSMREIPLLPATTLVQARATSLPTGETMPEELRRLRREVAVLRQEQAFAKKVAVYFAKESR